MADDWTWLKDVLGPVGAAVLGFLGGRLSDRMKWKSEEARREAERKSDHEAAVLSFDQVQMTTITDRFKALLDGYERRINDLVDEVSELKNKYRTMQKELEDHRSVCGSCANYRRLSQDMIDARKAATGTKPTS